MIVIETEAGIAIFDSEESMRRLLMASFDCTTEGATQTDPAGEQCCDGRVVAAERPGCRCGRQECVCCPCGGYMNDWHSHASDCPEINDSARQNPGYRET